MASINYMKYILPEKEMSIEEYFNSCKDVLFDSEEKAQEVQKYFLEKAGFQKMAIGEKGKLIAMFEQLVQEYLEEKKVDPKDINYIYYTDTLTVYTDDMKCIPLEIQNKFQFTNASVVEINQQCASCIWTIGMASRMLRKGEKAILLTANMMSGLAERYKPHSVIGDGVAIMELSGDSGNIEIIDYEFKTKEYVGEVGFNNNLDMMKSSVKSMEEVVRRNGMDKQDLSYIIHQNLSKEIYEIIFSILFGISDEKMFWDNISDKAHVGDTDLIVNLYDLLQSREVKSGDMIMLFAIGEVFSSANYNCILLKVNNISK